MKKTIIIISSILLVNCASTNDSIYSKDDEVSTIAQQKTLSKSNDQAFNLIGSEATVMNLEIASAIQGSSGGCSYIDDNINGIYVTTRAFGPNPLELYGYQVRGYGRPSRSLNWKGIRFIAGNSPATYTYQGQTRTTDNLYTSAISMEFPFEANVTYELTLDTIIEDVIYKEQHDQYEQKDDYNGLQQSQAFPTVAIELTDSPIIRGNNPCGGRPNVNNGFVSNYYKTQKAEITVPPSYEKKTFTYNFTLTESQKAFIIYFLPEKSGLGYSYVPESSFNMYLTNIKIVKKAFDPAHLPPSLPCNKIGGFRC